MKIEEQLTTAVKLKKQTFDSGFIVHTPQLVCVNKVLWFSGYISVTSPKTVRNVASYRTQHFSARKHSHVTYPSEQRFKYSRSIKFEISVLIIEVVGANLS